MRTVLIILTLAGVLAAGVVLGTLHAEWSEPTCYEDSVLMWDGETNDHTDCVPLDVLDQR